MGEEVAPRQFTREDRQRYRTKVHRCLDAFAVMLAGSRFDFERPMTGMEVELNLVDNDGDPAMRNAEVLEHIADPAFTDRARTLQPRDQRSAAQPRRRRRASSLRDRRTGAAQHRRDPGRASSARTW